MIQDLQEVADPAGQDGALPHESVEGGDGAHARPEGDRPLQGPAGHPQGPSTKDIHTEAKKENVHSYGGSSTRLKGG